MLRNKCESIGYKWTDKPADAELLVINGCIVTGRAEGRVRRTIGRYYRVSRPFLVITGCYGERIKPLEADLIFSNAEHFQPQQLLARPAASPDLAKVAADTDIDKAPTGTDIGNRCEKTGCSAADVIGSPGKRARAYLKIQDGCSNNCTYCIVRLVRRNLWFLPPEQVYERCLHLRQLGYNEVVLLGANLSLIAPDGILAESVRMAARARLKRIRLGSLELDAVEEVACLMAEIPQLCRHIHVPLQSGSNRVLRRMGRGYRAKEFVDVIDRARHIVEGAPLPKCEREDSLNPGRLEISTDVIAGFPGETEKDMEKTIEVLRKLRIIKAHVFPFSPRPGTEAAELPGHNPGHADGAAALISQAAQRISEARLDELIESRQEVLIETITGRAGHEPPTLHGYTDGYVRINAGCQERCEPELLRGRIISCYITERQGLELRGFGEDLSFLRHNPFSA